MDKNLKIAEDVLEHVGGKGNVKNVFHCATRLRFQIKDMKKVDEDAVKKIDGVLGVMNSGGMYQLIIGQNVEFVYDYLCDLGNFKKLDLIDENLDEESEEEKKFSPKKIVNNIFTYMVASMTPIIYPLLGAALWNTVATLLGPDVLDVIAVDSELYLTCGLIYDALFYFLPIYIGYSAAKALNVSNPVWGMLIGGLTIIPSFAAMVGTAESFSLFGLVSVPINDYGSTILPVLLGVWIFTYLYKFIKKITPSILFGTVAPFIIFFVMIILMLAVFAPLGTYVGEVINDVFMWMYNSILPIRIIGYALLTAIWPVITLGGMHMPISLTAFAFLFQNGNDPFTLVCAVSAVWLLYGMALGAVFKYKKKENKAAAASAVVAGFVGGIVEPAIYSVAIKSKSAIKVMLIGGAILGVVLGIVQPVYYNVAATNVIGPFAVFSGSTLNLIKGLGCTVLAIAIGAIGVIMFANFDEEEIKNSEEE
ncbi:PTS transporter subunit EIIB [Breznakia pachnodae]|uniref:PTS system beta-glucosides-specific IIC component n=1 Tax=Breznakia pachnodae TaxID=265178 RepID=A0ABU0E7W9_9FIRM|nr:PTS transporter subunit EIIB [Breznakia pachnodae]MDQ0363001.1 PTS system beta-glucosides-specific IIC component [Breznakia pachnodae]